MSKYKIEFEIKGEADVEATILLFNVISGFKFSADERYKKVLKSFHDGLKTTVKTNVKTKDFEAIIKNQELEKKAIKAHMEALKKESKDNLRKMN